MSARFLSRTRILAATLLLVAGATAVWAASDAPGTGNVQGTDAIATGPDMNVDGFYEVNPDDYGQWASVAFSGGGDTFNPAGAFTPMEATFSSAMFLAVPSRSQRTVLTENPDHLAIASDGSLLLAITSPSVASDANMDGVNDTLNSSFTATGTGTSLSFDLTQSVMSGDPGVAIFTQTYLITNNDAASIDIEFDRVFDGDLLWAGTPGDEFSNDEVGTMTNGSAGDMFVFEQEPGDPATAITVSSPQGIAYFGGKHGVQPAGGPPPYDFGTDTEVFDNFGFPASWVNNIAGVGYDTDGTSGATPPGSTSPEDAFIGLCVSPPTLGPGESVEITVRHTIGSNIPAQTAPPEPLFDIEIPTLGQTGMIVLVALLLGLGVFMLRRRQTTSI